MEWLSQLGDVFLGVGAAAVLDLARRVAISYPIGDLITQWSYPLRMEKAERRFGTNPWFGTVGWAIATRKGWLVLAERLMSGALLGWLLVAASGTRGLSWQGGLGWGMLVSVVWLGLSDWEKHCAKLSYLLWMREEDLRDKERASNPEVFIVYGPSRERRVKEAWSKSWVLGIAASAAMLGLEASGRLTWMAEATNAVGRGLSWMTSAWWAAWVLSLLGWVIVLARRRTALLGFVRLILMGMGDWPETKERPSDAG